MGFLINATSHFTSTRDFWLSILTLKLTSCLEPSPKSPCSQARSGVILTEFCMMKLVFTLCSCWISALIGECTSLHC